MNQIPEAQNRKHQLQRLGAQRNLYRKVKTALLIQVLALGPLSAAIALLALLHSPARAWAAVGALIIFFTDAWLTHRSKEAKQAAARIQEAFDCETLDLPWNAKLGSPVERETEIGESIEYQRVAHKYSTLEDWYTHMGTLPLALARLRCQRVNLLWDSEQRRHLAQLVKHATALVLALLFGVGLYVNPSFQQACLALTPLLPLLKIAYSLVRDHEGAAAHLDKLNAEVRHLQQRAENNPYDPGLQALSRTLQDEIYVSRSTQPPVFDLLFLKLRARMQVEADLSAADYAEDWRNRNPQGGIR